MAAAAASREQRAHGERREYRCDPHRGAHSLSPCRRRAATRGAATALGERRARRAAAREPEAAASRGQAQLIEVRERLREKFLLIAPCTHQAACGLLVPENERHWCHQFALPPSGIMENCPRNARKPRARSS